MNIPLNEMSETLARVSERIELAASRSGRSPDEITLIAISKTHPAERILQLYEAGVRHFGENRVQEWESKRAHIADLAATWHMIGHVQSNKATRVVQLFNSIDTLDSVALAERLERALTTESIEGTEKRKERLESRQRLRVLIEVKLDPEPAKSGVSDDIGSNELPRLVEVALQLPRLELRGLMGVPPYFDDPKKARPYFRRLRELRDALRTKFGDDRLPVLSMGMSHDFEVAIEEGATEIRVGTALFGERREA
jgi:pyridoxal phosphate enzyme (YggS family)